METSAIVELLLLLLIAASLIAMVTVRLRLPYTIALVLGGLLIDLFHVPITSVLGEGSGASLLTPDVIFMLFLPGLLFEAGININVRHLRASVTPIVVLAVAGVLIATLVTGYAVYWITGVPLLVAMLFGSLISATDPISVLALFKEMGVSKRLSVLVEGESLFNDGTAVVLFQILLAAVATGELDVVAGVGNFLVVAGGGAALGAGLGYLFSKLTERIDDPRVEITLTTILAYGSFLLAEHVHVSGVIATVGAGLMIGNYGAEVGMSSRTRVALWTFWEYLGFVINSLVFLLIGIDVHIADLLSSWQQILGAIAAVLIGRVLAIYLLVPVSNLISESIPRRWQHVLVWGGIHGSVSMALAMSLTPEFEHRALLLQMTFGVVAFSIIVQGLTIKPLMARLGVAVAAENEYDQLRVRQMAASSAMTEIDQMRREQAISRRVHERLREEVEGRVRRVQEEVDALHEADPRWAQEEEGSARVRMLTAEKTAVQRAINDGLISLHTGEQMLAKADLEIDRLRGIGH